jgi:hypothetical protein
MIPEPHTTLLPRVIVLIIRVLPKRIKCSNKYVSKRICQRIICIIGRIISVIWVCLFEGRYVFRNPTNYNTKYDSCV